MSEFVFYTFDQFPGFSPDLASSKHASVDDVRADQGGFHPIHTFLC